MVARVTFAMDELTVEASEGELLHAVSDRAGASIPFGCKNGNCGTCLVQVTSGQEALNPPSEDEKTTLAIYGGSAEHRLACQCRVNGDLTVDSP
jgi:ferredoxin